MARLLILMEDLKQQNPETPDMFSQLFLEINIAPNLFVYYGRFKEGQQMYLGLNQLAKKFWEDNIEVLSTKNYSILWLSDSTEIQQEYEKCFGEAIVVDENLELDISCDNAGAVQFLENAAELRFPGYKSLSIYGHVTENSLHIITPLNKFLKPK